MIEPSDMIRELRSQPAASLADGAGEAVRFEVGPVEIEATVAVGREAGANARVRLWVVDAGADGKYTHAQTQTVRVTLTPKVVEGDGPPRSAQVSGDEAAGER